MKTNQQFHEGVPFDFTSIAGITLLVPCYLQYTYIIGTNATTQQSTTCYFNRNVYFFQFFSTTVRVYKIQVGSSNPPTLNLLAHYSIHSRSICLKDCLRGCLWRRLALHSYEAHALLLFGCLGWLCLLCSLGCLCLLCSLGCLWFLVSLKETGRFKRASFFRTKAR